MPTFKLFLETIEYRGAQLEIEAGSMAEALQQFRAMDEQGAALPDGTKLGDLDWGITEVEKHRVIWITAEDGIKVVYAQIEPQDLREIDATSVADNPEAAQSLYEQEVLSAATPAASGKKTTKRRI